MLDRVMNLPEVAVPSLSKLLKMTKALSAKKLQAQIDQAIEKAEDLQAKAAAMVVPLDPPVLDGELDDALTDIDDGSLTIQPVDPGNDDAGASDFVATTAVIDTAPTDAATALAIGTLTTADSFDFSTFDPRAEDFAFPTATADDLVDFGSGLVVEEDDQSASDDELREDRLKQAQEMLDEANQLPDGALDLLL